METIAIAYDSYRPTWNQSMPCILSYDLDTVGVLGRATQLLLHCENAWYVWSPFQKLMNSHRRLLIPPDIASSISLFPTSTPQHHLLHIAIPITVMRPALVW